MTKLKQDWPLRGIYELNGKERFRVVQWKRWYRKPEAGITEGYEYIGILEDGILSGEHSYFERSNRDPKVLYAEGMLSYDEIRLIKSLENIEADHVYYGGNEEVDEL